MRWVATMVVLGALLMGRLVLAADPFKDEPFADLIQPSNPIQEVTNGMSDAAGKLKKLTTGKPTQDTQKEVVKKLDDLIAQLEKECENCKNARLSRNPTKPRKDSVIGQGPGGMGDLLSARKGGKNWGDLPAKERERILQSLTEGFPAQYQAILEGYFRRLAEESPKDEGKK